LFKNFLLTLAFLYQFHSSAEYKAKAKEKKVCLELPCSAREPCRCEDCTCCSVCSANCDCVGATVDPDMVLQRLLLGKPCVSYT
jgi:hypothetical protein